MKWRLGYRTITKTSALPMVGAADGDPGFFSFDRWEDQYRAAFQLMVAFAFWSDSTPTQCRLLFVDPDADRQPAPINPTMVLIDTVASGIGPLQSFYEDNLGQGFAVPWRERTSLPYQVQFETIGEGEGSVAFQLMLWWEPKFPSVQLWELLCRMPGLIAGMERSVADTIEAQVASGDELMAVMQEMNRQGRLPQALARFVAGLTEE